MATTTNILALLKFFAQKQNSASVDYTDFCSYLKRYSQHHLESQPALSCYLEDPVPALQIELDKLLDSHQILLINTSADKQAIIVIGFYIEKFSERYKDIAANPAIPFPFEGDLPKHTPHEIITKDNATTLISELLNHEELNDKTLYGLILPNDAPTILLPSTVSVVTLIEDSVKKIQNMLKKEEHHDYFLKKITVANPGREMLAKNFFNSFSERVDSDISVFTDTTDTFYLWNQLCFFIKQDYEKVKDFTQEDLSVLQAIYITEIAANYYKSKAQEKAKKEAAFKILETHLQKTPYYFTMDEIIKFSDGKGIPLLGQYTDDELKEFIHKKTQEANPNDLPEILIFKTYDETRYFVYKTKVLKLILRLCTDARIAVHDAIKEDWMRILKDYDFLPEMKDQNAFEARLEKEVRVQSPILSALLKASYLPLLGYETADGGTERISLFANGSLLPYSDILLINKNEVLSDARLHLPFWYTTPIISWIARLLFKPPKAKKAKNKKTKTAAEKYREEELGKSQFDKEAAAISKTSQISKKAALREAARSIEQSLVPSSSTLQRELDAYEHQWNRIIGKDARNNLTEDVNSLIRDYIRKVLRTIKSDGLTLERIQSLSQSLVDSPGLQKISDKDALLMYCQLFMVKLVKNIPT